MVVPGGIFDDLRMQRFMHASHARLGDGRPVRVAGNRVFPNGFLECRLARPRGTAAELVIEGASGASGEFRLTVDGEVRRARFGDDGVFRFVLNRGAVDGFVRVRIQKQGAEYPAIFSLGTITTAGPPA